MAGGAAEIREYLAEVADLDPGLLDSPSVDGLIEDRTRQHGLAGAAAYLQLLRTSPEEVERLVEGIAVPETWLFRYPESYQLLARFLESLRSSRPVETELRMLSAGCASGEEPCSMAVTAAHAGWALDRIAVDAIDRSHALIASSCQGTFGHRALRTDIPLWARRWLRVDEQLVEIDPAVAGVVRYVHGNVMKMLDRAAPPAYDVIFCRNLLIYLSAVAGTRLLRRLAEWLAPGGLLFVGHAEMWLASAELFVPVSSPHTFALHRAGRLLAEKPGAISAAAQPGTARHRAPRGGPAAGVPSPRGTPRPAAAPSPVGGRAAAPAVRPALAEARAMADSGRLQEALAAVEAILAADGPGTGPLELLGSLQLALDRPEAARDCFRKVIYLEPSHEQALLQLAIISQRLGDKAQAVRYRRRAERAHRTDPAGSNRP